MTAKGTKVRQAIAIAEGRPTPATTTFATIGLSDYGGYEMASFASTRNKSFIKAIFDVASFIADGYRKARKNTIFEKALARYYNRCEAGHLLLTDVPLPGIELPDLKVGRGRIRWLHAWPVTADEIVFGERSGMRSLLSKLDGEAVYLADLDRPSFPGVSAFDPWSEDD